MKKLFSKAKTYDNPVPSHGAKEFEVNNWIVSDFVVNKLVPVVGFHPFPLNELMMMTSAMCYFKPQLVFEWGTNIGKSARIFHEIAKGFGIQTQVHSIDLPDDVHHNEHPKNNRGVMVKGIADVVLHQGDGLACSSRLLEERKPTGRVLFFVDGDHSYDSVQRELSTILDRAPDAAILLHDTFYQSEESGYNIGPFEAIRDVMKNRSGNYKVISTNLGLPGMTLIYR